MHQDRDIPVEIPSDAASAPAPPPPIAPTPHRPAPAERADTPAAPSPASTPHASSIAPAPTTGFAGFVRIIALLTLVSRFAGLVRESIAFKIFATSPVWSAFSVAFVMPNVFRRLFGEGALTAAFIPEYAALLKESRAKADTLASLTMAALLAFSGVIVLLTEIILWLALDRLAPDAAGRPAIVFTMVMLPYMPLICATAVLGGMLQTNGRFAAPAAAPILFNGCMIAGCTVWAWGLGAPLESSAMAVAVSVTLSGVVQLAWCLWALRGLVTWRSGFAEARANFNAMLKRLVPVTIASGTLQLGIISDQLIAGYAVTVGPTLPGGTPYPVDAGGSAVLSYASRLYQFPLGVFGIAVATAVFPALARAWAGGSDRAHNFAETIRHGVRLSLFIGLPATVGLIVVGHNLCSVVFSSEAGKAGEVARIAQTLTGFSVAVWAYSLTHVFNKAFYAAGDTKLPMRVSLITIACNFVLNLVLIWPLAEAGLAWATTITATGQCLALAWLASRRYATDGSGIFNPETRRAISMTLLGSVIMGCVLIAASLVWPLAQNAAWFDRALALARDTMIGIAVFGTFAMLTRREEIKWLLERNAGGPGAADFG